MGKARFDSPWSVANMNALFDDVSAAKGDADSLTEKIGEMDAATAARDGEIAGLGTRVTALETSQTAQDGQITGIGTRVTALETSQTAQDGQITGIGTRVTALETSQTAQDGQISAIGTRVTTLETSQTAQDSALTAISKKIGMKNLFDFDAWKTVPVTRGTGTAGDGTYTITSTAAQSYTEYNPAASRPYPEKAKIKTEPGKKYRFSWKASGLTDGKTYRIGVWKNGANVISTTDTGNISSSSGEVSFTAASDCNFVTFWVNLAESGTVVTFSEIMMREDGTDESYEQYAPSNRELYEMILAMQGGA